MTWETTRALDSGEKFPELHSAYGVVPLKFSALFKGTEEITVVHIRTILGLYLSGKRCC